MMIKALQRIRNAIFFLPSPNISSVKNTFIYAMMCSCLSLGLSPLVHAEPPDDVSMLGGVQTNVPIWAHPGAAFAVRTENSIRICSVGVPLTDAANNRYFLTASHCFRNDSGELYNHHGSVVYTDDGSDTWTIPIGKEFFTPQPIGNHFYDVSLVKLFPQKVVLTSGWVGLPKSYHNAVLGDRVCALGLRESESRCGEVTKLHQGLRVGNYHLYAVSDSASICIQSGDSGGPVYDADGVVGIISSGRGFPWCASNFVPIGETLDNLRQEIPTLTLP